jgi:peptidoglycan/xylan/chitin deacetylase (PgdA/CDA1 family)
MAYGTDAIHRVTGRLPNMFRAPYGAWSPTVFQYCEQMHMTPLDWSVDPRDWSLPGVAAIVDNIMENTRTGSIILEHDGGGNRSETVAALSIVLPRLVEEGFHFRTP